ncbi:MAG: polymer-forming cytoskeletal protein [Patescibacteria group bacterium]|jgi:cytoskeletal protein CcmA (bactofilin family)|nr:polymer-forming cytoskeletal protein [Patescibacteria group bacterium]
MFEKKEEEIVSGAAETIVGTSVKLKGNLKSDGDITIDGSVNGEIKTKGAVNIGSNAHVIANVKAKKISVAGTVQGNIEATERLTITETGRIYGDIIANVLSISAGAIFTGKSTMMEKIKPEEIEPIAEIDEVIEESKEKNTKK